MTFGELAAREALHNAGLTARHKVALLFGSNLFDRPDGLDMLAAKVARAVGVRGPCLAVSTACASSASALALADDMLRCAAVDAVLAGGADVVTPLVIAGFRVLRLLAPDRCAPFSLPVGLSLGEGAAFIVLERARDARARRATATATLAGAGLAGDAFHPTSPDPRGEAIFNSIQRALGRAGLPRSAVAYINAHGTGTETGDIAECRGIARAFSEQPPPISASKSIVGHAQGAAGALEAVLTLEGLVRGVAPPTLRHTGARPGCAVDAIAEGRPRPLRSDTVLSINAGFGGAAAALVFSAAPTFRQGDAHRRVWLRSIGDAAPGATLDAAPADPSAAALTAAVAQALADADICASDSAGASRGLFCVQAAVSPTVVRACEAAILRRGLDRIPPTLFSRALLISAAGSCSAALDLRGPLCAFAGASSSAASAVALAAEQIASGVGVTLMCVAAVDEQEHGETLARCVALSDTPDPRCSIELAGWAIAAADLPDDARRAALAAAGRTAVDVDKKLVDSSISTLAVLAATAATLRTEAGESAMITAVDSERCSCSLVFVKRHQGSAN